MRGVAALVSRADEFCSSFKNIREITLQSLHDLLEPAKGDALIAILEPMQRGSWQTEPPRKPGIRHVTASFAQKFTELQFERARHIASLPKRSFRMWNILDNFILDTVLNF
jgi:hypothetical protein